MNNKLPKKPLEGKTWDNHKIMMRITIRSKKIGNKILNKHRVINSLNFSIIGRSLRKKMKI